MAHYRMTASFESQASQMVVDACKDKEPQEQHKILRKVIDAAYHSEIEMQKLKEILDGCRN
jgi:transcriptional regulator NrdR family protein